MNLSQWRRHKLFEFDKTAVLAAITSEKVRKWNAHCMSIFLTLFCKRGQRIYSINRHKVKPRTLINAREINRVNTVFLHGDKPVIFKQGAQGVDWTSALNSRAIPGIVHKIPGLSYKSVL